MGDRFGVSFTIPEDQTPAGLGSYTDTLWFDTIGDYDAADVDAMKKERLDNWVAAVSAPPDPQDAPVPPSQSDALVQAMDALTQAQTAVQAVIDAGGDALGEAPGP